LVRQAKTIFCRTKSQNIDLVRRRWYVSGRTKFNLAGRPFMTAFIGRAVELAELRRLLNSRQANLVIVEGRRRIGKSRLVEGFGRGARFLQFVGLAPTPETTAQTQRDAFSRLLSSHTGLPKLTSDDWGSLFQLLARETARAKEAP
jgi:AAA+ ATPase superfamily predicted ATPase